MGTTASILGIRAESVLEQRLQALGFRVGREISIVRKAWLGGPLHVRIGTTEVIMRRRDARAIQVQPAYSGSGSSAAQLIFTHKG
jgi:ferrous iron transport protein A